jgi:hypothetical protein
MRAGWYLTPVDTARKRGLSPTRKNLRLLDPVFMLDAAILTEFSVQPVHILSP